MKIILIILVMSWLCSPGQAYPSDESVFPSPGGIIAAIAALTFFFAFIRKYASEKDKDWKREVASLENQNEEDIKKFFFLAFGIYPIKSSEATAQRCREVMTQESDPQRKEILALLCARAGVSATPSATP